MVYLCFKQIKLIICVQLNESVSLKKALQTVWDEITFAWCSTCFRWKRKYQTNNDIKCFK